MTAQLIIEHQGQFYDPWQRGTIGAAWAAQWERLSPEETAWRTGILREGRFYLDDVLLSPARARFEAARIMGSYRDTPEIFDPSVTGPVRPYVPGLWNHGTIPMLGGPPKAGKSTLVSELSAALIIPGRRFLGRFDPVEVAENEKNRDVWYLNGENPPDDIHKCLLETGLQFVTYEEGGPYYHVPESDRLLIVEHLDQIGGPDVFDLTQPNSREFWEYRLLRPSNGERPPLTVIADGVTAMLGSNTMGYGAWYFGFKKLLRALDIPNGLAVGHTGLNTGHLMQGVESMAGPDGLWTYDAREPDKNPSAPRYFWASARGRAPVVERSRIVMGPGGRLIMVDSPAPAKGAAVDVNDDRAENIRIKLRAAGAEGLFKRTAHCSKR
jgi:hypothetical protein